MKILHIGREENLERYPAPDSLTGEIQKASLPMGKSTEEYLKAMRDAEVIIADAMAYVPEELILNMPDLKMIHCMQLPGNERFSRCRTDIVSNAGNVEKCSFK